jgi:hypothetical protein
LKKLAVALPIAGFAAAIAYLVIGAVSALFDNDKYGKLDVPAEARIELEQGHVAVYYQERTSLSENESLDVPGDLAIRVTLRGEPIELSDERFGSSYEVNDLAGTQVAELDAPEDGAYGVVTSGAGGRRRPEVTFGEEVPLGTLLGRSGLILLAGLLGGALAYWVGEAQRRRQPLAPAPASPASPPPSAPPPPAPGPETADELRRLEQRRDAGELSEEEYRAAREAILARI